MATLKVTPLKDNQGDIERALLTDPSGYAVAVVDVDVFYAGHTGDNSIYDAVKGGNEVTVAVEDVDGGAVTWDVKHYSFLIAVFENRLGGDPFTVNAESFYDNGDESVYEAIYDRRSLSVSLEEVK